jgi:CRISPR/Cas system Type II protein with McrA/HNH and RuvC-like nuclease domain
MSTPQDADLILKLYDLRREATMREARNWMFTFNPTSVQDVIDVLLGDHSGHYRMVISYWEMAAAMVNNGSIDEKLFNETNGEHLFVYSKIQPVIEEVRKLFGNPEFLSNLEALVKRIPNYEETIKAMQERMKKFGDMRAERAAKAQTAGQS